MGGGEATWGGLCQFFFFFDVFGHCLGAVKKLDNTDAWMMLAYVLSLRLVGVVAESERWERFFAHAHLETEVIFQKMIPVLAGTIFWWKRMVTIQYWDDGILIWGWSTQWGPQIGKETLFRWFISIYSLSALGSLLTCCAACLPNVVCLGARAGGVQ